jgi:hypothetical protein
MKLGRPPTAPVLPLAMIGISARPAGSPQIKLQRLPVRAEGAKCLFLADFVAKVVAGFREQ